MAGSSRREVWAIRQVAVVRRRSVARIESVACPAADGRDFQFAADADRSSEGHCPKQERRDIMLLEILARAAG